MTAELLKTYEVEIERIALFPSEGGVFEVVVDGELIFSKKHSGRHANPGEVKALLQKHLEERSI